MSISYIVFRLRSADQMTLCIRFNDEQFGNVPPACFTVNDRDPIRKLLAARVLLSSQVIITRQPNFECFDMDSEAKIATLRWRQTYLKMLKNILVRTFLIPWPLYWTFLILLLVFVPLLTLIYIYICLNEINRKPRDA